MKEHHIRVVERLKNVYENDKDYLALILCGSCASGNVRDDSDIDVYLVATDEKYAEVKKTKSYFFERPELVDYEDGYIDGKIINLEFLQQAIVNGSEPTRASFIDSYPVFSNIDGLEDMLKKIVEYPEESRQYKVDSFYSQIDHNHYYAEQALLSNDKFLLNKSVFDMVFFAVRLALAYNRILFPCAKSMFRMLEKAGKIPADFIEHSRSLIGSNDLQALNEYRDMVISYYSDCAISEEKRVGLIVEGEMGWYTKVMSVYDL